MTMRSFKERVVQTLGYEIGALIIMVPLYQLVSQADIGESFLLLVLLSLAVMCVTPLHNILFDWVEFNQTGRVASDRSQFWRVIHAISHEFWAICATLPIIMYYGNMGFWQALMVDIGLTISYMLYAYCYYWLYDKINPMNIEIFNEELLEGSNYRFDIVYKNNAERWDR